MSISICDYVYRGVWIFCFFPIWFIMIVLKREFGKCIRWKEVIHLPITWGHGCHSAVFAFRWIDVITHLGRITLWILCGMLFLHLTPNTTMHVFIWTEMKQVIGILDLKQLCAFFFFFNLWHTNLLANQWLGFLGAVTVMGKQVWNWGWLGSIALPGDVFPPILSSEKLIKALLRVFRIYKDWPGHEQHGDLWK